MKKFVNKLWSWLEKVWPESLKKFKKFKKSLESLKKFKF